MENENKSTLKAKQATDQIEAEALNCFCNLSEQDQQFVLTHMHRLLDEYIAIMDAELGEE